MIVKLERIQKPITCPALPRLLIPPDSMNSAGLPREMPYSQIADSAILLNSSKDGGMTSEGMHS
jgi:hypothetical protein